MGKPELGIVSSLSGVNDVDSIHMPSRSRQDEPAVVSGSVETPHDQNRSSGAVNSRQAQSLNPTSSYYKTLPNGVTILSTIHSPDGDENEEPKSDDDTVFGNSTERFQNLSVAHDEEDETSYNDIETIHENKEADAGTSLGGGMKRLNRTDSHEFLTSAASGRVNMSNALLIKGRRWGGQSGVVVALF